MDTSPCVVESAKKPRIVGLGERGTTKGIMRVIVRLAGTFLGVAMLVSGAPATPSFAQVASPTVATASVLHLSETAQRNVPRDLLRANLAAEFSDSDPTKVQAEINRRMTAALARIKAQPDIAVETTGYSVQRELPDKAPPRWHGSQSLSLTGKDYAALLALVGVLQAQGLVVVGLTPELSPDARRALEDSLTDTALTRLQQRAARVAATLGTKVQGYRDVEIGNASPSPPPFRAMALAAAPMSASMPPPVAEPGEETVSVTVTMQIDLAPRP
jgi:predicted secreted protein